MKRSPYLCLEKSKLYIVLQALKTMKKCNFKCMFWWMWMHCLNYFAEKWFHEFSNIEFFPNFRVLCVCLIWCLWTCILPNNPLEKSISLGFFYELRMLRTTSHIFSKLIIHLSKIYYDVVWRKTYRIFPWNQFHEKFTQNKGKIISTSLFCTK